jgi:hypothetical protein
MHTSEGSACGKASIHDMIRRYADLGFSGAVVTDHFLGGNTAVDRSLDWPDTVARYARAYYEGLETAQALDFDLLFGVEEGLGYGKEILAYGFQPEFLLERPFLRRAGAEVWFREVDQAGGFVAYAHPFRRRDYILDPWAMPDMRFAHGVEVYNRGNTPEDNRRQEEIFGNSGTILITGSDTHHTNFDDPCGIVLPRRVSTSAQLASHLRTGDFQLSICRK